MEELILKELAFWQFEYDLKVSRQMDPFFELQRLNAIKGIYEKFKTEFKQTHI